MTTDQTAGTTGAGWPQPPDPAELPTRRERRLAARAAGRVDARGPRTGEFALTDEALAARDAAGLPADLTPTGRWRRHREGGPGVPDPRESPEGGRHRGR